MKTGPVEQLKSTDERENVIENSNHVRNTQEYDIFNPLTENHEW